MKLILSLVLLLLFFASFSQPTEPKFGTIELSDLQMTRYENDTSAAALILFDYGYADFSINSQGYFQYTFERHCRIKIFKKSAFHLADRSIQLYKSGATDESIYKLNAVTYNLEDGKIVKSKISNENVFTEHSKRFSTKKFAFTDVKEGSILEFSYTISSIFLFNFRGWTFQSSYPTLWSQFTYVVPEYFVYRQSSKGYLGFDIVTQEPQNANYYSETGQTTRTTVNTLAIKNVPAFISEPYIDCEDNYIQSIEFELSSIQYPGQIRQDFSKTWKAVNEEMNEDEDFGLLLKTKGFIKDTVDNLCINKTTEFEKAIAIYSYVQNWMEWNKSYRIWAMDGLKKPYLAHSGSSVEINLLLTLMLQTAGLKASPVLFSTRGNGFAMTYSPSINSYNSVLSKVVIEGKDYLLDATNKYCPFGTIPPNDINGDGRVIDEFEGSWANLETGDVYKETKSYNLELSPDGIFTGRVQGRFEGYAGVTYRNYLSKEKTLDEYFRKIQENTPGLEISSFSLSQKDNIYLPLEDSLEIVITENSELIGDKIIFKPLLIETIKQNNFTLEERKYPVDFNYLISETYVFYYKIPSGYAVESLPKSLLLKLPDNSISVTFSAQAIDNNVMIVYKRNINKKMFLPDEYLNLKSFYDILVKKHNESVILKKI